MQTESDLEPSHREALAFLLGGPNHMFQSPYFPHRVLPTVGKEIPEALVAEQRICCHKVHPLRLPFFYGSLMPARGEKFPAIFKKLLLAMTIWGETQVT